MVVVEFVVLIADRWAIWLIVFPFLPSAPKPPCHSLYPLLSVSAPNIYKHINLYVFLIVIVNLQQIYCGKTKNIHKTNTSTINYTGQQKISSRSIQRWMIADIWYNPNSKVCLRRILTIFWPNSIGIKLWARTYQSHIQITLLRKKWRCIVHRRRPPGDVARKALDWNTSVSRRGGRLAYTWRSRLDLETSRSGKILNKIKNLNSNKSDFKNLIEALCSLKELKEPYIHAYMYKSPGHKVSH